MKTVCPSCSSSVKTTSEGRCPECQTPLEEPTTTIDVSGSLLNPPVSDNDPIPETIGRYCVEQLIGQGGFAKVYLARDPDLDRLVAIKIPHVHRISDDHQREEFLKEARILAKLHHPNILTVFDFGQCADGRVFLVSQYVSNCVPISVERVTHRFAGLRGRVAPGGRLNELAWGAQMVRLNRIATNVAVVANALHYAHMEGVFHRDIKPANILFNAETDQLYVADFGLAIRVEDFGNGAPRVGSPAYMSPEQATGKSSLVDGRSDVFSLGVVLYELLTCQRPFQGHTVAEVLGHIIELDPRPPRQIDDSIPEPFEEVCLRALAKSPADRYATALDMANDLRELSEKWALRPTHRTVPVAPINSRFSVATINPKGESTWSFTVANRTGETQIVTRFKVLITEYEIALGIPSRVLKPVSVWDVQLPQSEGIFEFEAPAPILIASEDAVVIDVHFRVGDNQCPSSCTIQVIFESDQGVQAASELFRLTSPSSESKSPDESKSLDQSNASNESAPPELHTSKAKEDNTVLEGDFGALAIKLRSWKEQVSADLIEGETPAVEPSTTELDHVVEVDPALLENCPWCEESMIPVDGFCSACSRPI